MFPKKRLAAALLVSAVPAVWPWRHYEVEPQYSKLGPVLEIGEDISLGGLLAFTSVPLCVGLLAFCFTVFSCCYIALSRRFSIKALLGLTASVVIVLASGYSLVHAAQRERAWYSRISRSQNFGGVILGSHPVTGVTLFDRVFQNASARLYEIECDCRSLTSVGLNTRVRILRIQTCNRIEDLRPVESLRYLDALDISYIEVSQPDNEVGGILIENATGKRIKLPAGLRMLDARGSNIPLSRLEPPSGLKYLNVSDRELTADDETWINNLSGVDVYRD